MNTNTAITVICFSPTHTSKTIAEAVATGMARARCGSEGNAEASASCSMLVRTIDLTLDRSDEPITLTFTVTYGNRDYEDALVELYDLALSLGLTPFAAGAFIGEHSYSTPEMPVAEGRPDSMDLADASIFGGECARKLESPGAFAPFHIKGNRPYKEPSRPASSPAAAHPSGSGTAAVPPVHSAVTATPDRPDIPAVPVSADGCPLCGECAAVCPTGAIVLDSGSMKVLTAPSLCIRCCACVKACPAGMRTYSTPFAAFLHEHCSARREPETFL